MSSRKTSSVVRIIAASITAFTLAGLCACEDDDAIALGREPVGGAAQPSVAGVSIPDSDWSRELSEAGFADQPEWMQNHLMRTYSFGALLLGAQGRSFDPEVAFAAAMLHDLGLAEPYISPDRRFEIDGADAAARFLSEHGRSADESERVWQAVALHLYPFLSAHVAPEAALVALGAAADAVGLGLEQLAPADVDEVLAAYPRLGFKEGAIQGIISQCERKPLAYALHPWVEVGRQHIEGFAVPTVEDMIRAAPFVD